MGAVFPKLAAGRNLYFYVYLSTGAFVETTLDGCHGCVVVVIDVLFLVVKKQQPDATRQEACCKKMMACRARTKSDTRGAAGDNKMRRGARVTIHRPRRERPAVAPFRERLDGVACGRRLTPRSFASLALLPTPLLSSQGKLTSECKKGATSSIMPKNVGASQKRKATVDTSFLSKLQMLREFVGDAFSEGDLSACLRQCGCNIELAAERLMTGQYQSKQNKTSFFNSVSKSTSTPANNKRHRATPAVVTNVKKTPLSKKKTLSVASIPSNATALKPSPVKTANDGRHLWLCERWIVGLSTTKNGRFRYQETLGLQHSLTGPAMVRFRGSNIEGTLRPNVCALLTPLLREETPLISVEAHALMEERGVPIGGDVPLSLR